MIKLTYFKVITKKLYLVCILYASIEINLIVL